MTLVSIGTFARMTHVSVKRLRHYHDVGVLPAAQVDPDSGYRYYDAAQADMARLVVRLRDLGMALPRIAAVVGAGDSDRRELLAEHLHELQLRLSSTSESVALVRSMLEPSAAVSVECRELAPLRGLSVTDVVAHNEIAAWCEAAFTELRDRLRGRLPAGPGAATFDDAFFVEDVGEVVAFLPVIEGPDTTMLPGGPYAVAVHEGPFTEVGRTYSGLGRYVADAGLGLNGPIRETYLVGPPAAIDPHRFRTEVAWPIAEPAHL